VLLVSFTIEIYYDVRSYKRQIRHKMFCVDCLTGESVMFSLAFPWRLIRGEEVQLHSFLPSEIHGCSCSVSHLGWFTSCKRKRGPMKKEVCRCQSWSSHLEEEKILWLTTKIPVWRAMARFSRKALFRVDAKQRCRRSCRTTTAMSLSSPGHLSVTSRLYVGNTTSFANSYNFEVNRKFVDCLYWEGNVTSGWNYSLLNIL
jgi:hypothetical protein